MIYVQTVIRSLSHVTRVLSRGLGLLLSPERCSACSTSIAVGALWCDVCRRTLEPNPHSTQRHQAPFLYGGALAQAMTRMKYQGRPDLAKPLVETLLRELSPPPKTDVVIPVPLHPLRLAERGFNQAALLARPIARAFGVRFDPLALRRLRDTPQQASLTREARQRNVTEGFALRNPTSVQGLRVLLVDDVRTTGSTLRACTHALRIEGASEVYTLVLAAAELD